MMRIALFRCYSHTEYFNYGDDYVDFSHLTGLDWKDVTAEEFERYRSAVELYNRKHGQTGKKLVLLSQVEQDDEVKLLKDLDTFREKEILRLEKAKKKALADEEERAEKRRKAAVARTAKKLGVSVETLLALAEKK